MFIFVKDLQFKDHALPYFRALGVVGLAVALDEEHAVAEHLLSP